MEAEQQQQQQLTEEQKLHQEQQQLLQAIANNSGAILDAQETIEEAQVQNRNLFKKLRALGVKMQEFYDSKEAEKAKAEPAKPSPFVPEKTASKKSD